MNAPGPTTGSSRTDGRLFAIARANTWVHVYPDKQRFLQCEDTNAANPGPLDYFDAAGRRYAAVNDEAGKVVDLRLTTDPPDVAGVHARLCAVVKTIDEALADRMKAETDPPGTVQQARAQLPKLESRSLSQCHDLLAAAFGDGDGALQTPGSFWHRFWCH